MEEYQETKIQKLKKFLRECKRVIRVTRKPNREEFKTIVKVSGLGMIIIGLIGFLIAMGKQLLF
ncbi:protein translocase SEC61 complex subunit gamma [Candidatus Woesearchaeota archaeon]|nr:protein translocase SEC61 complex subunit gamma [Candidatus Woesearchaeota archaeon]